VEPQISTWEDNRIMKVVLHWKQGRASIEETTALRKLLPQLATAQRPAFDEAHSAGALALPKERAWAGPRRHTEWMKTRRGPTPSWLLAAALLLTPRAAWAHGTEPMMVPMAQMVALVVVVLLAAVVARGVWPRVVMVLAALFICLAFLDPPLWMDALLGPHPRSLLRYFIYGFMPPVLPGLALAVWSRWRAGADARQR
jgi:hypothetical protein